MFSLMPSYLLFWKIFEDKKRYDPWKIQKKQKNAQKNVIIFSNNLNCIFGIENVEIWFSPFL